MANFRSNCQKRWDIVAPEPENPPNSAPFVSKRDHGFATIRFVVSHIRRPIGPRSLRLEKFPNSSDRNRLRSGGAHLRQRQSATARGLGHGTGSATRPGKACFVCLGGCDDRADKAGAGFHVLALLAARPRRNVVIGEQSGRLFGPVLGGYWGFCGLSASWNVSIMADEIRGHCIEF